MVSPRQGLLLGVILLLGPQLVGCKADSPPPIEAAKDLEPRLSSDSGGTDSSRDGYVVWESNRTGTWRIWSRDLSGGRPRQLTPDDGKRIHCCPHISPDGQQIAYMNLPPDQKAYPRGGAIGPLYLIGVDGSRNREILAAARNYFENRAVVWKSPTSLIYIEPDGRSSLLQIDTGEITPLTTEPIQEYPWLIDSSLSWATSGDATFAPYDSKILQIPTRSSLEGCQSYFTHTGGFGFWVAAPGGPLRWIHLDSERTGTLLTKSDPRLPVESGYLYFPMISSDRRWLAFGASNNQHSHLNSDYEIFVAALSPEDLSVVGPPQRITSNAATDRFPDVYQAPLPLGSHHGEAPYRWVFTPADAEQPFVWDYGDGESSTGIPGEHLYKTPGRYRITAIRDAIKLEGWIEVAAASPPQPLSTQLLRNGFEIAVLFDEKISIAEFTAQLESGLQILGSRLDRGKTRLRIQVQEPIRAPDRLRLRNIEDRAQRPNRLVEVEIEVEPPRWPSDARGLVFVWQTGDSPNLLFDEELQAETAVILNPRGLARLDSHFALLPQGGSFVADDSSLHRIRNGCQRTNELSIELTVRPLADSRRNGVLLTTAGKGWSNFRLSEAEGRLHLEIRNGGKGPEGLARIDLMKMPPQGPSHVVVSFSSGSLSAYLNGKRVYFTESIHGGFFHWRARPLVVGSDWNGSGAWIGGLEGLAIYNRVLDSEEVWENHRRYQDAIEARPEIEQWAIDARLLECSDRPTIDEISPYREALLTCEYRVERDLEGFDSGTPVRVAHWAILDGRTLATPEPGTLSSLLLSRYSDNPQLESLVLSDTLDRLRKFPMFYSSRP